VFFVLNVSGDGLKLLEKRRLLLLDAIGTLLAIQCSLGPSLLLVALWLLLLDLLGIRVLLDGGMGLLVNSLNAIGSDSISNVLGELTLVSILVIGLERLHVGSDVDTEDVLAVNLSLVLFLVGVVAGKAAHAVWDVQTTVGSALHGTEDLGTGRGAVEADVQVALEGAWLTIDVLNVVLGTVDILGARVDLVELELLEQTASEQETRGVGRGVVGKADLDTVAGQLVRVGSSQDDVSLNASISNLACDVFVGKSNHQTILGRVVFVFLLKNQTLAGIVVSLALSAPLELDLKSLEVSFVFNHFKICHLLFSLILPI